MSDVKTPQVEAKQKLDVVVMDQLPGPEPRAESPLQHANLNSLADTAAQSAGVQLRELKLLGHLVLRGSRENASFVKGVERVVGVALPETLQSVEQDTRSLFWISPDEWLLLLPGEEAFGVEQQLRDAIDGHYAVVNVSGGQTLIELSGEQAVSVLKKSTGYDVDARTFPVGKVVTTTFAKTQAIIRRSAETRWELVVRRSFADYLWHWLQDASAEYGLSVQR
ncbi:sarcosine oxidase subunit gamma [Sedimenticola sp.]|uniref:sarcosine oxidase subunit gamma n=1 Tax=Sedimenticola sp. TaxID=1940285 RepID=UPI003D0C0310